MKQRLLLTFTLALFSTFTSFGQEAIAITESTVKVPGLSEQVLYYGFAEGDEIIFDFQEMNRKELKELEIMELPSSAKFTDYKVKKVEAKKIKVAKTGIYRFRFTNSSLAGRVCKFKIQRIPGSEQTRGFDSGVHWRTVTDTTYTTLTERYLVRTDTAAVEVGDLLTQVSSQNAVNGNTNRVVTEFILPANTVSWSYYIGVGTAGQKAYENAREKFIGATAASLSRFSGYGPMAALALHGLNYFGKAQGADNVKYWFISDWDNVLLFKAGHQFYQYRQGDVINEATQMKLPRSGKVYLGLLNDNSIDPIQVIVKATAITVTHQWGTREVRKAHVQARQEPYLKASE